MAIGYTKIGGSVYEIGRDGLEIAVSSPATSESGRTTSTGGFSGSKTITAPAGHDYLLIANITFSSGGTAFDDDFSVTLTGGSLLSQYYGGSVSSAVSSGGPKTSMSITDIVPASDTDTSVKLSFSGSINVSSATNYTYRIGMALIALN